MRKEGERVMNNRVNLDNSSGKSLGFIQISFFLTLKGLISLELTELWQFYSQEKISEHFQKN